MEVIQHTLPRFVMVSAAIFFLAVPSRSQEPGNPPPTFTKDVAPILQKHCETCHRPGEAAPFRC